MKNKKSLSAIQLQAMHAEMHRQMAEYDRKHSIELDALVLWVLHEEFGFGPERLRRFHDKFVPAIEALIGRYELDKTDDIWLCTYLLKQYGVDLEAWENESRNKQPHL